MITFANAALHRLYEYGDGQLLGKSILDFIASDAERETLADYLKYLVKEQPSPTPYLGRKRTKSGNVIDVEIAWDYKRDEHGQPTGFVGIVTDITERKQAEEALRESEERFRVALLNSPVVVFCQDSELRYSWIHNPVPGFSAADILGKTDEDLLPPEEASRLTAIKRRVLDSGVSTRQEIHATARGEVIFHDLTVEPLRDATGTIVGITGASFDITERKRAEEALRQSTEKNATLIGAIPDMMFTLDRGGVYVDSVPADGLEPYAPPDQFLGRTVFEVMPASLAQDVMRGVELALDSGRPERLEYELELDDGRRQYEARIVKSKEDEVLAIVRDVTAQKRLEREEELRRIRDELEGRVEHQMLGKNPYGLTFREFTVLHLAANGKADKEIADQLAISTFTVSKHVANILGKMAASSRTEACVRALREGMLT